jgi:hypothetical protein
MILKISDEIVGLQKKSEPPRHQVHQGGTKENQVKILLSW